MLNYWMHLNSNSKSLQESSAQLVKELDHRIQERDTLKLTLSRALETQAGIDDPAQISRKEELLSHRGREIDGREQRLEPLMRLEITALNALTRMLYRISETLGKNIVVVGVEEQVQFCAVSLERMLEEIIKASNLQRADPKPA
jgi:hypothetical protein